MMALDFFAELSFLFLLFLLVDNRKVGVGPVLEVNRLDAIKTEATPRLRLFGSAPDIDPLGFSGVDVLDKAKAATLARDRKLSVWSYIPTIDLYLSLDLPMSISHWGLDLGTTSHDAYYSRP